MTEKRELICIGCPMGCRITVTLEDKAVTNVSGNTCKIGDTYARGEVTNPRRTVTGIMKVHGGELPVVSVKTTDTIPKDKIWAVMEAIHEKKIQAPVTMGQILIENAAETGVSVAATKNIKKM